MSGKLIDGINIGLTNPDNIAYEHLHIDSRNRTMETDTPSKYQVNLEFTCANVISVELIDGYFPKNNYTITKNNNFFIFQEFKHDEIYNIECEIPIGIYSISKLLRKISKIMNELSITGNDYKCKLDEHTNKVTISGDHKFNLLFNIKSSICFTLGFSQNDLEDKDEYESESSYNLDNNEYISLHITTNNGTPFDLVKSTNNRTYGAFAILKLKNEDNKYYALNTIKKFFVPTATFSRLSIEFRDRNGNLYDFNNQEHYFVLNMKKMFGLQKITSVANLY